MVCFWFFVCLFDCLLVFFSNFTKLRNCQKQRMSYVYYWNVFFLFCFFCFFFNIFFLLLLLFIYFFLSHGVGKMAWNKPDGYRLIVIYKHIFCLLNQYCLNFHRSRLCPTREGKTVPATIFFSSHGCIYTKVAVSASSMNLCLSCHVTWTVLHAWLHYGISIKTMHFEHC